MAEQELRLILSSFGFGGAVAAVVVFLLLRSYLPSFLAEKGKNLATKEDVAEITDKIEKVRLEYATQLQELSHQHSLLVEELRRRHQLRLAAVDRRLQAHQDAFALWRKLVGSLHGGEVTDVVIECQDWWNQHCLYLDSEARRAFRDAYDRAHLHAVLVQGSRNGSFSTEQVMENFNSIMAAGGKIVTTVELPTLGEKESEMLPPAGPHRTGST